MAGLPVARPRPAPAGRDERLDLIRGLACLSFIAAHFEAFTWLNLLFWERLGIFSGAELFLLVSGLLVGMVHRRTLDGPGVGASAARLYRRAFQLYRSYLAAILLVWLVDRLGVFDMRALTSFTDFSAGVTHRLMPERDVPLLDQFTGILLLRYSPHQLQILGLYTALLAAAPLVLLVVKRGGDVFVLAASVALWVWNRGQPMMPTGAQFEYAFPLLSWQLYFFCALVLGYRRGELARWFHVHPLLRRSFLVLCATITLLSFLFAQATDSQAFPPGLRLPLFAPETFRALYQDWFLKNTVGPGRVICASAFLVSLYNLPNSFWSGCKRALGWLLLPLGRATLYVFLIHILFLAAVDQLPGYFEDPPLYDPATVWQNSALLIAVIASIWLMVRHRLLFRLIPR